MRKYNKLYFGGQITGVEGYVESAASGLIAGMSAAMSIKGEKYEEFSSQTAIGSLGKYISNESITNFQPMNVNFGIMDGLGERIKDKKLKAEKISERALKEIELKK